ncbi:hypothetical protein Btru_056857 [Bulinus truncatus]|nr:hypothetical protein Btru_056857 [Bulinus truncatus]
MADTDQLYPHSKQTSFAEYPRSIFHAKYGINLKKRPPASLLHSEDAKKMSPPPCKQLRLQDDDDDGYAPDAKTEPDAVEDVVKSGDRVGEVVVVKSEPVETDEGCDRDGVRSGLDLLEGNPRRADQDGSACSPRNPAPSSTSFAPKSSPQGFDQSCSSPGSGTGRDALPDSSTGTCEQLIRDGRRLSSVSSVDESGSNLMTTTSTSSSSGETVLCQVCGDLAAGFYCGAYICEACKRGLCVVCHTRKGYVSRITPSEAVCRASHRQRQCVAPHTVRSGDGIGQE